MLEAGLPESFNVLLKELQAFRLDVELIEDPTVLRRAEQQAPGSRLAGALAREAADSDGSAGLSTPRNGSANLVHQPPPRSMGVSDGPVIARSRGDAKVP